MDQLDQHGENWTLVAGMSWKGTTKHELQASNGVNVPYVAMTFLCTFRDSPD
jgi:hypothetical protein